MEDKTDDFEEEVEELEKEEKVEEKIIGKKQEEQKQPSERYVAFYQEPRIGIIDTVTKEPIIEGLPDLTNAKLEALKLNKLDKIGIVSGIN